MTGPNFNLDDDLKSVTITFPTEPPVAIKLDASAVSDMIENLGIMRAAMQPAYPERWQGGQGVSAIPDPAWYTEPELLQGNSLLHILDPRFGWLHYMLDSQSAKQLAELLNKQASAVPATPAPDKTN